MQLLFIIQGVEKIYGNGWRDGKYALQEDIQGSVNSKSLSSQS